MPIEKSILDALARAYVNEMTSIRGRRVHRLLMREFAGFDFVFPALAEDGAPALLALSGDGRAAVCLTDGRGEAALIGWARLDGAAVTRAYDLLRDSLPIRSWTIWHPGLARVAGALTVPAEGLLYTRGSEAADVLNRLGC